MRHKIVQVDAVLYSDKVGIVVDKVDNMLTLKCNDGQLHSAKVDECSIICTGADFIKEIERSILNGNRGLNNL